MVVRSWNWDRAFLLWHKTAENRKRTRGIDIQLQDALAQVRAFSGLLPIGSSCKEIRDDDGYWNPIETYIGAHSEAQFSHGICPDCMRRLYPGLCEGGRTELALS